MQNKILFKCRYLKIDEAHLNQKAIDNLQKTTADIDGPFICLKTMQPFGPDQNPADPGHCKKIRHCFAEPVDG